jgi:hypothetical protein
MAFDHSTVKAPASRRDLLLMTGAAAIAGGMPNVGLAAQSTVSNEHAAGFARKRLARNVPALSFVEHHATTKERVPPSCSCTASPTICTYTTTWSPT